MTPYYEDDFVTLWLGDCREVTAWQGADALVTDPPYGISHLPEHRGAPASWSMTRIQGDESTALRDEVLVSWLSGHGQRREKFMLPRAALVFGSWKAPRPRNTRAVLVWDKGPAAGMGDMTLPWKPSWEEIYVLGSGFVGTRDEAVYRGVMVSWESQGRMHPHQKPEGLLTRLIAKCPPGVVADPFAGSGSTLVAAKRLGRQAVGVEVEERYCEAAAKRLAQGVLDFAESPDPIPLEGTVRYEEGRIERWSGQAWAPIEASA